MRAHSMMRVALVAVAVLLAAGGTYWYVFEWPAGANAADPRPQLEQNQPKGPPATVVEVAVAEQGEVVRSIESVGTLQSNESVIVRPEIGGRIASINFKEGERVRKGALLFSLDDSVYRAELAEAEARIQLARRNSERATELFQRRVG